MEPKDKIYSSLIIIVFIIGIAIGYYIHQPGTEIKYINNTVEVQKTVEKTVEVTASQTSAAATTEPTSTMLPDYEIKIYDPAKDKPTETIELKNWKALPDQISIRSGSTVLITVINYPGDQLPPWFIMGSYNKKLGASGMIIIKFNKPGTYEFEAIIPNEDPSILPRTYAEGSIRAY